jgi:hypothetical protein
MKFVAKNPLARDNINTRWFGNKRPHVILLKGIKLIAHGGEPKRIKKSMLVGGGNR